jgi:hypothetical protein
VEDLAGHARFEGSIALDKAKNSVADVIESLQGYDEGKASAKPQGWLGSIKSMASGAVERIIGRPQREASDHHASNFDTKDSDASAESPVGGSELGHRLYSAASQAKEGVQEEAKSFLDSWRRIFTGSDAPRRHTLKNDLPAFEPEMMMQTQASEQHDENDHKSFSESMRDGIQHIREAFTGAPHPEDVLGTHAFDEAVHKAREMPHDVKEKARDMYQDVRRRAEDVREDIKETLQDARSRVHESSSDADDTSARGDEATHAHGTFAQSIRSHLSAIATYFTGDLEPVCKPKASDAWKQQRAEQHHIGRHRESARRE